MSIVRAGRGFLDAARELDLRSIEGEITRPVRVLVAGSDPAELEQVSGTLFGASRGLVETLVLHAEARPELPRDVHLALVVLPGDPSLEVASMSLLASLRAYAIPTILVHSGHDAGPGSADALVARWLPELPRKRVIQAPIRQPDLLLKGMGAALASLDRHQLAAIGYRFPPLREHVVDILIRDASRSNGQFALASSLPSLVPIVGGIVSSVADLFILTKNQVLLVFRIAGIYGRDVSDRTRIALEIAPVIGGAFLWRTVARSLVALLPAAIGAVPKTLVAFVGTFVVGQIAHVYYREGRRPSAEMMDQIRREGLRAARRIFGDRSK